MDSESEQEGTEGVTLSDPSLRVYGVAPSRQKQRGCPVCLVNPTQDVGEFIFYLVKESLSANVVEGILKIERD